MTGKSLKDKTIKGTIWSAADAFLGQGMTFIVGIFLARLLSPSEYGLIGICTIFITVLGGIVDCGFSNALIRKKNITDNDYSTMFILNMVMSIVLYVLLYFCAPYISLFFGREELTILIRVTGIILVIQALAIVQITVLTKRIDFKKKTKASLISAIISGIIGVGMALSGCGVWSLVAQQISKQILYVICLWRFNHWIPRMEFRRDSFEYMWGFGWKLMFSSLLNSIWNQLYQVVVGKCYSPATLGQYSRSKEYVSLFSSNLTTIVQRVSFPVLSEIQDDTQRLVAAYRKIIRTVMLVTCVCLISLGAIAEPLIYCLIGSQWYEAATYMPLICISMSLYPLHAINLNMLQVQGRSDLYLYIEIVKKIISIFPIALGIFVSIYCMLIGSIVTGIISFFLNSYYTGKSLGYSSLQQLKDVSVDYGIAIIVALSIYFLKYICLSYWLILPIQIVIGTIIFVVICEIFKINEYFEIKKIIQGFIMKIKE